MHIKWHEVDILAPQIYVINMLNIIWNQEYYSIIGRAKTFIYY